MAVIIYKWDTTVKGSVTMCHCWHGSFREDDLNGNWLSSGFQTEGPHGQKSLAAELRDRQLVLSFLFFFLKDRVSVWPCLSWNLLCRPRWPQRSACLHLPGARTKGYTTTAWPKVFILYLEGSCCFIVSVLRHRIVNFTFFPHTLLHLLLWLLIFIFFYMWVFLPACLHSTWLVPWKPEEGIGVVVSHFVCTGIKPRFSGRAVMLFLIAELSLQPEFSLQF